MRSKKQQEAWEAGKTAEQLQGSYPTPSLKIWVLRMVYDDERTTWVAIVTLASNHEHRVCFATLPE